MQARYDPASVAFHLGAAVPGRRYLFVTVLLGLLAVAGAFVGAARFVWWQAGSPPTLPMLPLALVAAALAVAAVSAARFRSGRGVAAEATSTIRAAFLAVAAALFASVPLAEAADVAEMDRLQWVVLAVGAGSVLGALVVTRLVHSGLLERLIGALAPFGSLLTGGDREGAGRDPGLRFGRFLVVGSLAAAVVNAAIPTPLVSQPIRLHDEAALDVLIATEQTHLANNYLLYAQLRELAAGATIIVPPREILATYTLAGLSLLEVRTEDYDPELPQDLAAPLLDEITASGETETELDGETRPYVVAIGQSDLSVLRLVMVGDTVVVLDDAEYRAARGAE